ncbi:MAG: family 1 glycosylhydrolase [Chloroflexi bacterium]|nr:family 1 glycosylhydrolase [Chloroflexota bacterium]MCI0579767.1 family 1 glycosylhydrolase [Chloroflexota bacterium]MCI0649584.1 family 1 glycosylhydrolase [Chloroflexota bacterium]MCI0729340.1 family 1 glycosylhydrolase [Chloroflexota bacterium]
MKTDVTFPKEFLWGTATAAHQVEGNNINSDFWVLEHLPGTIFVEPSGDAIDHYHRYPEDIAMLAELGFNSYRFSIEWARVEPEEGHFSLAALTHYRRMLETCHHYGLKPVVTYHHFTSPRWLIGQGAWGKMETAEKFARYCQKTTQYLGDLIEVACTINEANIPRMVALLWMSSDSGEGIDTANFVEQAARAFQTTPEQLAPFFFTGTPQGREVILAAHRQAREAIKAERPDLPVGLTIAMQDMQAISGGEAARDQMQHELQDLYLEATHQDDFVGVQTYSRERFGPDGRLDPEEGVELTQMGYEFWPEAIGATLRRAHEVAGVPLIVTENGIGTADDTRRLEYYQRALQSVAGCLRDGLNVRGYFAWSAFDNFEWMLGYRPTFGLIAVDKETQERTIKPSARWLGTVARANGF